MLGIKRADEPLSVYVAPALGGPGQYFPAGHVVHAAEDVDAAKLVVPAGQYKHELLDAELYVPIGHIKQFAGFEVPVTVVYPPVHVYLMPFTQ